MSDIQSQCWICPKCYDDKHHEPGDIHCLGEQRDEAMTIAHLNQLESKKLRQQLADAAARVAKLTESADALSFSIVHELPDKQYGKISRPFADLQDCIARRDNGQVWLLRKQAEAAEAFAEWADPHWPKSQAIMVKDDARSYAYELRQQADELEAGGGNESI